jgi:pSer/pThr/pTyr-binding forkhead associated (FHA) protein
MKVLIRFLTTTTAGAVEHSDKIVDSESITIGRATDQVLHLKDKHARLEHAEIRHHNGEIRITTSALAGVVVNGRSQRDTRLVSGDVIEVGANILRVLDAEQGVDFALSFELSSDARREDMAAEWSAPKSGIAGISKRRLSWMLVLLVALFTLLLPALSLIHPSVSSVTRNSVLLPDDSLWLAGPVHNAHAATSKECGNCHEALFSRVADSACNACHVADKHVTDSSNAVLGSTRCASCHLEHNEPAQLVNRHQGLCADCHVDLPGNVEVDAASDFLDAHPDFKVSLLVQAGVADGSTEWTTQHTLLSQSRQGERSNLKFNHAVHLDVAGIVTPDGRRIVDCGDCHQPEPGGGRMRPISMDEHCSGCHTLNFDADEPARQVPHGDATAVMQVLVEYYSARLLGSEEKSTEQRIRRPGQALSREDRDRAAAEARVQALSVAEDLFERRACVNCHNVSRDDSNASTPWYVEPVRLTDSFLPHANFSHAAHDTEVTSCQGCHAAQLSESSADVLIPDIDTCRDCHGSGVARRNSASQTPSTCIMCHSFHFPGKGEHQ